MSDLKKELIKLGSTNPELRPHIRPVLDKIAGSGSIFSKSSAAHEDQMPGGLADKRTPEDVNPTQLAKGIKVEMEHTDDSSIAREIAMDHLTEIPDYYDRLEEMENDAERD